MHTYEHTYEHTFIHTYIQTYVRTYIHTYIRYTHTSIHPSIHTYIHTYIHIDAVVGIEQVDRDPKEPDAKTSLGLKTVRLVERATTEPVRNKTAKGR